MSDGKGLTPGMAHNAIASMVEMYRGIIVDYERREQVLRIQLTHIQAENAKLKSDTTSGGGVPNAVQESRTTGTFSRDVRSRGDKRVDSGALGQGIQGEEASTEKEHREECFGKVGQEEDRITHAP
jgi:hypothetical protein